MCIRFFDILISIFLLLVLLPVILLLVICISVFIGFPPFYLSKRVGIWNKEYLHIKFKSMLPGDETGRVFFEKNRITPFGRFIRMLHLDEIPELVLILTGKMSFVGPRALPRKLLAGLDVDKRFSVLPGNTGLAQVYLLKHGYLDKYLQVRLDNYYVQHRSLKYNLKIIVASFYYMLKGKKVNVDPELNKARRTYQTK